MSNFLTYSIHSVPNIPDLVGTFVYNQHDISSHIRDWWEQNARIKSPFLLPQSIDFISILPLTWSEILCLLRLHNYMSIYFYILYNFILYLYNYITFYFVYKYFSRVSLFMDSMVVFILSYRILRNISTFSGICFVY